MRDVPLTLPQEEFIFSNKPNPAIVGGLGSGKTRAGTMRAITKLLACRGLNVGYYMPTYDLLNLRAIPGVEADLEMMGLRFTTNKKNYAINVHGFGQIIFRSYDRPERIIAYETADSIVDEIDTIEKQKASFVWRKITERNRQNSPFPNSIGCVTSPDQGFAGFVFDRWVTRADDTTQLIKASTYSNPYLPDDYIENIRRNYDPALAEMYINGEFVSLTANKVYHYFNRETHHSEREIQQGDRLHIGLDFNVGGCCAVTFVIDGDRPTAVDEFVSHDTRDIINNIASRYPGYDVTIYPDSSGKAERTNASASDIEILENAGLRVDAPSTNPFIRDRINAVNAQLSHDRMKVNTIKCPKLTQALETQGYGKDSKPEKFTDHPAIDDWNDGMGYFISRCYPVIRNSAAFNINW